MTKRYTVRTTWAEVVQHSVDVVVHADREDDAIAVAMATVRNGGVGRRSINTVVTKKEPVDPDNAWVVASPLPEPGPGRRDAMSHIRENLEAPE